MPTEHTENTEDASRKGAKAQRGGKGKASAKCGACGMEFSAHLGLEPMCFALSLALDALEAISTMPRQARARRVALGAFRMVTEHKKNAEGRKLSEAGK